MVKRGKSVSPQRGGKGAAGGDASSNASSSKVGGHKGSKSAMSKASRKSTSSQESRKQQAKSAGDMSRKTMSRESRGGSSVRSGRTSAKSTATDVTTTTKRVTILTAEMQAMGLRVLDMSSQGMTVVQNSLFQRTDIGELDVSKNNIRSIPSDVQKLKHLIRLDLAQNCVRCTHPSDYTGLPGELSQIKSLIVLNISENNLPYIPPAVWSLVNLRELDISRNKINVLLAEVGNLASLRHLNAQQCNLSSLPPEIAYCQQLERICLYGNAIESLPETMRELPNLKRLDVNYRCFNSVVDPYMETLMANGQIPSEHIPQVIFEIKQLESINLDSTKINALPDKCLAALKELSLENNYFRKVPNMIYEITTLVKLNLSKNHLASLPEEIGRLANLEDFKFNGNSIITVPDNIQELQQLEVLELCQNRIEAFPSGICKLLKLKHLFLADNQIPEIPDDIIELKYLETFDLTGNLITALPVVFYKMASLSTMHVYQNFQKYGLWLHLNPLKSPPDHIWKSDEISKIYMFLRKLQIKRTENLQRQKMVVLGAAEAGKTSLIRTLVHQKSCLTATMIGASDSSESTTTTAVVEVTAWNTDNQVKFMIHDVSGHEVYAPTTEMFLDDPRYIYVIVYDHYRFVVDNFYHHIGQWLDLLQVHVPGAVVKLVGTHIDRCRRGQAADHLVKVKECLKKYQEERIIRAKLEIDLLAKVMNKEHNMKTTFMLASDLDESQVKFQIDLDHLNHQKSVLDRDRGELLRMQEISLVGSAEEIRGIHQLIADLEELAVDKTLFPHAQRYIAPFWYTNIASIKLIPGNYCTIKQIQTVVRQQRLKDKEVGTMEDDLKVAKEIIQFMCLTGELLCLKHLPELKDIYFQCPQKLYDMLRGLFRHDIRAVLDFKTNRVFKCRSQFDVISFQEAKDRMLINGQISRSLLVCLWFYLKFTYEEFNAAVDLVPKLDVCFLIPQPEVPGPRHDYVPLMVLPWAVKDPLPEDISDLWPDDIPDNMKQLEMIVVFPVYPPRNVFEQLSCRLHDHLNLRIDWKDTVFGQVDDLFLLMQLSPDNPPDPFEVVGHTRSSSPATRCSSAVSGVSRDGLQMETFEMGDVHSDGVAVVPVTTENIQKLNEENQRETAEKYPHDEQQKEEEPTASQQEHPDQSKQGTTTVAGTTSESELKSVTDTERPTSKTRRMSLETVSERSDSKRPYRRTASGKRISIADSSSTWISSRQPIRPGRPGACSIRIKLRGVSLGMMVNTLLFCNDQINSLMSSRAGVTHYKAYVAHSCQAEEMEECFPKELFAQYDGSGDPLR